MVGEQNCILQSWAEFSIKLWYVLYKYSTI